MEIVSSFLETTRHAEISRGNRVHETRRRRSSPRTVVPKAFLVLRFEQFVINASRRKCPLYAAKVSRRV